MKHTFVICAYKESPYLEECVKSVLNQTIPSDVLITTSTKCTFIDEISKKYQIPVLENTGEKGISGDWNYAFAQAKTEYLTIAHQDDWYCETYTENVLKALENTDNPILAFTNYGELRNAAKVDNNLLLGIKRALLFPMKSHTLAGKKLAKRLCLSFGNPVCCPSVTYVKNKFPEKPFENGYQSNLDWAMLEKASLLSGSFCYVKDICMYHRIHEDSTTSKIISENKRGQEDYDMLRKFWPKPLAWVLAKVYGCSEYSNSTK